MSTLRISDASLLPDVDGTEKIPTGGRGDYAISVDQIKDHIFQDVGKELVGLGNVDNTSDLDKPVSTAQQAALNLKADKTYVDTNLDLKADKTNVYTRTETSLALSRKADLVDGVIPESQIPSSFNDVLEFTTPNLPIIGESGKIYVTTDTNRTWRWSGNQYIEISNGGVSDSALKLQTARNIANVEFNGTQDINIPHNNLTNRNVANAHAAEAISTASGENQQHINDYTGAKWRNKAGGYDLNARVMLENGDIVKSTIANNTVNPNVDMTGWDNTDEIQRNTEFQIQALSNYIVYAEKYGASLNEAMTAINTEFAGKRVRVYVPSDFPVTATVNLNIDCDLDLSTLQIQNDIDVIFEPKIGWSGTTTPCDVYVNNKSCRIGWNLKKALGVVSLNKMRFFDVGNKTTNTSASYWMGFSISTVNIKRIDLYEPTTINSYVVPNSAIGDAAGTNRNIIIDGIMTASDFVSDINIHNHVAIDLLTVEDSDALVVSTGATSIANIQYNIDIYNGYAKNCQKRQYKFMLPNNPTGIRLHGDSVAIGDGTTYSALDMYGTGTIEASGSILGIGFMIGINSTESVKLVGPNYAANFIMDRTAYLGNQVRGLNQTGTGTSDIELYSLFGVGGTELFVNNPTHRLRIQKCKHTTWLRVFSATGNYSINALEVNLADISTESITRAAYLIAAGGTGRGIIRNITFRSTSATKQQHFIQSLATENLTVENGEILDDAITGSFIRAVTTKKIKLRNLKAPSAGALIRLESACDQVLMDQCVKPTSNVLYYDVSANSTNLVELNTQTF